MWPAVKRAGYQFAICKCSEGQDWRDPTWTKARVQAIRQAGITLGVYHYLRPRPGRTGDVEADWAVKTAKSAGWGKPGDLRLVVDIEETALSTSALTRKYLREFVGRIIELTGHRPIVYSFPSFLQRLGLEKTLGCPLWIAHFGVSQPIIPKPWLEYAIWQHTSTGRVNGIEGNVDLNVASRSLPLIRERKPAPPKPVATRRQRITRRMRRARSKYLDTRLNSALRIYLISKARLGLWDDRYLLYWGVNGNVNDRVKRFWTRAYAAGLVPTSGRRSPRFPGDNSHHIRGSAGDVGLRRELIGTAKGVARMIRFQAAELKRARRTKAVELELIGPNNWDTILGGRETDLAEGTALEQQHDTHVHYAAL
jgi:lysozyme